MIIKTKLYFYKKYIIGFIKNPRTIYEYIKLSKELKDNKYGHEYGMFTKLGVAISIANLKKINCVTIRIY